MKTRKQKKLRYVLLKTLEIIIVIGLSIIILFEMTLVVQKKFVYPVKYNEFISEYSKVYQIEETLILSVIKVESNFNENAVSDKGAIGLMQIKEETGEYIKTLLGDKKYDLKDAKTNIRYGMFYLKYLIDKFNDINTALCAYNAGEGKVKEWLKKQEYSDDGITLKSIPYEETDNYISKINRTIKKYKNLYPKIVDKSAKFE